MERRAPLGGAGGSSFEGLGRQQAKKACPRLREMGFRAVTSSDLSRARKTAVIIASELDLEWAPLVSELKERHLGEICGLTSPEIDIRFPGLLDRWRAGQVIDVPAGEAWPIFSFLDNWGLR